MTAAVDRGAGLLVDARIEMTSGSTLKHIYHAETGNITVQRELPKPLPNPYNYGFIHGTLGEDGDELDVFVISGTKIALGARVRARPVGVIFMEDENGVDDKIIATWSGDPVYSKVSGINELEDGVISTLVYYIQHNKDGLPGRFVKINGIGSASDAASVISKALDRARQNGK